jgi:hypothetical protein
MVVIEELHSRPGRLSRVSLVSMHAVAILEKYIEDFGRWYTYVLFDVGYPGSVSGSIIASKVFSRYKAVRHANTIFSVAYIA